MLWHIGHIDTGMQSKVVNPSKFSGWTVLGLGFLGRGVGGTITPLSPNLDSKTC